VQIVAGWIEEKDGRSTADTQYLTEVRNLTTKGGQKAADSLNRFFHRSQADASSVTASQVMTEWKWYFCFLFLKYVDLLYVLLGAGAGFFLVGLGFGAYGEPFMDTGTLAEEEQRGKLRATPKKISITHPTKS
jgi:hypothetical protein